MQYVSYGLAAAQSILTPGETVIDGWTAVNTATMRVRGGQKESTTVAGALCHSQIPVPQANQRVQSMHRYASTRSCTFYVRIIHQARQSPVTATKQPRSICGAKFLSRYLGGSGTALCRLYELAAAHRAG
jgi:hypothetical protein